MQFINRMNYYDIIYKRISSSSKGGKRGGYFSVYRVVDELPNFQPNETFYDMNYNEQQKIDYV